MNKQLIIVGTLSAAVGAVVSWAITADHYDNLLKDAIKELEKADTRLNKAMDWLHDAEYNAGLLVESTVADNHTPILNPEEPMEETSVDLATVAFGTIEEADAVLMQMKALVDSHGWVSVQDFFEISGVSAVYDDSRKGWLTLDGAQLVQLADGIAIMFPEDPKYYPGEPIPAPLASDEAIITINSEEGEFEVKVPTPEEIAEIIPPGETVEETRSRLAGIIAEYTDGEQRTDEFIETAAKIAVEKNTRPITISQAEFADDSTRGEGWTITTLTYFPDHRLLIDEDEEVVAEVPYVIGWENLSKDRWGALSHDPDTVYVRNKKMETDFEINRETEEAPPHHVQLGMGRDEYQQQKAAGIIKPPRGWDDE